MSYPNSPFGDDFDVGILETVGDDGCGITTAIQNGRLEELLKWLCQPPKITSYRVNTLKSNAGEVRSCIQSQVNKILGNHTPVKVEIHPDLPNTVIVHNWGEPPHMDHHQKEVIVDAVCAAAVLRGAHIYAPGVLAMMSGTQIGDYVSIYGDLAKKCKQGLQKPYTGSKIFIGNGIVRMDRSQLFCNSPQTKGMAVELKQTTCNCPPLGDQFFPKGVALLQNLPSIICIQVLDPQPGETILDMCASPGNKTTDIGGRMHNQGRLVAIDKTPNKVARLKAQCSDFGIEAEIYQADSSKLDWHDAQYDRILLDAPCSALGKRPQLVNTTSGKVVRSYVPLQRKLFTSAAALLKEGGVLVYSTCTVTVAENEGLVAWALRTFKSLQLVDADPRFGGFGLVGTSLSGDQLKMVQRFGPNQAVDSVGFFIAKFVKYRT